MVVLQTALRAAHPVLRHDVDEAHGVDVLAGLLGHLAHDRGVGRLALVDAAPRQVPAARCPGARCQLGEQQLLLGHHDGIRRHPLVRHQPRPLDEGQPRALGSVRVRVGRTADPPARRHTAG